jgi:hypothetical protein
MAQFWQKMLEEHVRELDFMASKAGIKASLNVL